MPFDFSKFGQQHSRPGELHPIRIYDNLPKGKVNDLWRGQYLALDALHQSLEQGNKNVVVALNTGGGKTVIGLLEGQSMTNALQGRVFYLCGSNQLIIQTAQSAEQLGLLVATYFNRSLSHELEFNLGNVQCLTNYQTLFNGKNTRFRTDINGIIFDDAHVASHIVRENYTLHIPADEFPNTYATIVGQLRPYFESVHRGPEFDQVVTFKDDPSVLFVPLFVWNGICDRVLEALVMEAVATKRTSMFAWEHLRNYLDLCVACITGEAIEISPFLPPVQELPFMSSGTRKIFLSATVQDKPEFVRTFGFLPDAYIEPKTSAGESERLIITPYMNHELKDSMYEYIVRLSQTEKVLIIPKSDSRARRWREHERRFSSEDFAAKVEEFKRASSGLLVASARFEGMDFPGDACRLLVIDGLPSGTGLLEKFLWSNLGDNKFLQGTVAARIIQAMGRISRGNDDYGAVFLLGDDVGDWITRAKNRNVIPQYTLAQLGLGEELTRSLTSISDLHNLVTSVLSTPRDPGWTSIHKARVQPHSVTNEELTDEAGMVVDADTEVAIAERQFLKHFWDRHYSKAVRSLEPTLNDLFERDRALAAWHCHWIGYAYLLSGNEPSAERYFSRAASAFRILGYWGHSTELAYARPVANGNTQGDRIANVLSQRGDFNYGSFSEMSGRLAALFSDKSSTNQYEEALCWLGRYLGFASNRPDSETGGRGPDVFWGSPEVDILIESKEDKQETSCYSKKDVGQALNHSVWYSEEFPDSDRHHKLMIVGPEIPAHPTASPGDLMHIWLPTEIVAIAHQLTTLLQAAYMDSESATFATMINRRLGECGLTYTQIFERLPNRPIQRSQL